MRSIVSDAVVVRAIDDAAALRPARRRLDAVAARPRHGRARVREAAPAGGRAGSVGGEMAHGPGRRLLPRAAHVGLAAALRSHGSRDPVDPARRRQVRAVVPAGVSDAAAHAPRAEDYATVQMAVWAANAGDRVLVAPGTYNEAVEVTKDVIIEPSSGRATIQSVEVSYGVRDEPTVFLVNLDLYCPAFIRDRPACKVDGARLVMVGCHVRSASVSGVVAEDDWAQLRLVRCLLRLRRVGRLRARREARARRLSLPPEQGVGPLGARPRRGVREGVPLPRQQGERRPRVERDGDLRHCLANGNERRSTFCQHGGRVDVDRTCSLAASVGAYCIRSGKGASIARPGPRRRRGPPRRYCRRPRWRRRRRPPRRRPGKPLAAKRHYARFNACRGVPPPNARAFGAADASRSTRMAVTLSRDRRHTLGDERVRTARRGPRRTSRGWRRTPRPSRRAEAVAREEDAGPLAAATLLQRERARVRLARHGALRRRLEDEIP